MDNQKSLVNYFIVDNPQIKQKATISSINKSCRIFKHSL